MGELRERRRVALPVVAGLGRPGVPIVIYLIANAATERHTAGGRRVHRQNRLRAGVLALVGRACPGRLRSFLLTSRWSTTSWR